MKKRTSRVFTLQSFDLQSFNQTPETRYIEIEIEGFSAFGKQYHASGHGQKHISVIMNENWQIWVPKSVSYIEFTLLYANNRIESCKGKLFVDEWFVGRNLKFYPAKSMVCPFCSNRYGISREYVTRNCQVCLERYEGMYLKPIGNNDDDSDIVTNIMTRKWGQTELGDW